MSETVTVAETQEPEKKWAYETDDVSLLPYINIPGAIFPEDFLVRLYGQIKEEKLLETVFPGFTGINLPKFVAYFSSKPIMVGCVKNPVEAKSPFTVAGFGWLWEVEGVEGARKANCGYVFFRRFWGTKEIREISRLALKYWFEESKVDVVYGAALKTNVRAQAYDREQGFRKIADLPMFFCKDGKLHDAVLVVMTKQEFQAKGAV